RPLTLTSHKPDRTGSSSVSKDWNLNPAFDDDNEKVGREFAGGLTSSGGCHVLSACCGLFLKRRELALQKQMPGQVERMEWKDLAARLRNIPLHWLRAARDLERKERGLVGLLLGPAARVSFSLKRVVSAFSDISCEAFACG